MDLEVIKEKTDCETAEKNKQFLPESTAKVQPWNEFRDKTTVITDLDDSDSIDKLVDKALSAPLHDALALFYRVRGAGDIKIKINIYSDNERATYHRVNDTSDIHPQVAFWRVKIGRTNYPIPSTIAKCNERGYGIAWIPNPVDPVSGKVTAVRAIWVDMDNGGRWEPGKFPVEPDIVVRSKNGDHLYWVIEEIPVENSKGIYQAFAIAFRGDPEVARPDHPMRLPGFDHCKDFDNRFPVRIVHQSNRNSPWNLKELLLKALGRDIPERQECEEYILWNRAIKIIGNHVGDFKSKEWSENKKSIQAFLYMCNHHDKVLKKFKNPVKWEHGKSPKYWLSFNTIMDFYAIQLYRKSHWLIEKVMDGFSDGLKERMTPKHPEFLSELEPRLRAYVQKVQRLIKEADKEYEEASKKDIKASYSTPQIEDFNPETIPEEDLASIPPLAMKTTRKGTWNLHTVDWIGLTSEAGLYLESKGDGWHDIRCPWSNTHSDPSINTAGVCDPTPGGKPGGFHCFHSHGHKTHDFMEWLVDRLGVEVVERYCAKYEIDYLAAGVYGRPNFPKMIAAKDGSEKPDPHAIENTEALLKHYGIKINYNLMLHREEIIIPDGLFAVCEASENAKYALIRQIARQNRLSVESVENDHLPMFFAKHGFHPVADWINSRKWDEKDRITELMNSLTLAPYFNLDLAKAVVTTWLVSGAYAAFVPPGALEGLAAAGVLVLNGLQGIQKTRWLMSLCPPESGWIKESALVDPSDRDSIQKATRFWIVELGELDALMRKVDIARTKGFLSERKDTYRRPYARTDEIYPRRTIFCGSVNPVGYLPDPTGNRRFWTIPVVACNPGHGIDIQQLWAQAAVLLKQGHKTYLETDAMKLLNESNKDFELTDPIAEALEQTYIVDPNGSIEQGEIRGMMEAFFENQRWGMAEVRRMCSILREMVRKHGLSPKKSNGQRFWQLRERNGVQTSIKFENKSAGIDDAVANLFDS